MTFLMRNAICCIGRPGAGLTAEAIASGTPMIFDVIGGVMPQEGIALISGNKNVESWIL